MTCLPSIHHSNLTCGSVFGGQVNILVDTLEAQSYPSDMRVRTGQFTEFPGTKGHGCLHPR